MKKLIKFSLLACMLALSMLSSVSAAQYTPITATTSKDDPTKVTVELPAGTYPTGANELLARPGVICPALGVPGNVGSQNSIPWLVFGTFNLDSTEVAKLKTSSLNKVITVPYDFGCSDLLVATGTGNYAKYTGQTIPTNPTNPGNGSDIDLSRYSTNTLPIYENSRVTYVTHSGNSIKISGYMLEQFNSYTKKDSFWREMIFISEDQTRSYRYNLNSSAVYNPYLNANKTLNPNGQYNYNYAFYNATINLSNVQEYWTKTPTSLPSGNYRVFIRMSDGKRSNVMSLRSTKSEVVLPASFYLVSGSTDVGFSR